MKNYTKETYTGKYGPFDYYLVPKAEYNRKLVAKLHELPILLSEWSEFYGCRFAMVNEFKEHEVGRIFAPEFVKVPIITWEECGRFGL